MQTGDGPIALVLAPTRELAAQIHSEAQKFATKVSVCVLYEYIVFVFGHMYESVCVYEYVYESVHSV